MEEIFLSAKQLHAGISIYGKVEVWKSALSPGGLWTSEEDGECIRLLCECSPKKTNTQQNLQLGIPKMISQMS